MAGAAPATFEVTLQPVEGLSQPLTLETYDPSADLVSRKLHQERCWEPFESRLLLNCLHPGAVAVDVGANLGYYALLFALAETSPGSVFAFEPAADNFRLLGSNLARNGCEQRVVAVRAALSDRGGSAQLQRSDSNRGDHTLHRDGQPRRAESVPLLHGAEFLASRVAHIDLLKIDTQGTEDAVLAGLQPLLEQSTSLSVLVELTPAALRRAGSSGTRLLRRLAGLGLPLSIVDHERGRLVPETLEALCRWSDNVEATVGDEGFMNIFAGAPPPGF